MHWQQACEISEDGVCYRTNQKGWIVLRYANGDAYIYRDKRPGWKRCSNNLEGFDDWKPGVPSEKKLNDYLNQMGYDDVHISNEHASV